ncbi:hypothetical protein [Sphingomonas adhaesiva]|uniref:hypothetical protein n=1 Tax=Sphingomonas adhaesiva TaxID=28212 RepID=UPI002FFA8CB6
MTHSFSSRRGIAPMLWVLLALCAIEATVTHFLLAHWWPRVAIALSLVTVATFVWVARGIAGIATHPSTIDAQGVTLRTGRLAAVTIPHAQIAGARCTETPRRTPGVLNLALVAQANVLIACDPPLERRGRRLHAVAHRLDDAPAFVAALERVGAGA